MFFKQKRSISIHSSSSEGNIYITNDEKFQGSDNCAYCQYNPCNVKKWYGKRKKIEDCKIFNKFDPRGKIIDQR